MGEGLKDAAAILFFGVSGEATAVNCRGREAANGSGEVDISAVEPHRV